MTESALVRLAARTVFPVLDLRPGVDVEAALARARQQRGAGVGGFLLFGGERETLPAQLAALKAGPAPRPLIASDLERGVGQQVRGASHQPPAMALGAAGDLALARAAGEALGREARQVGIDWVFAPVLDLADEPKNPIVGTRAFGADPEQVAAVGVAFVAGLQAAGVAACGKHFPGHGGTVDDSHATLPTVRHDAGRLRRRDLAPFAAAVRGGVASVMTAHVAYPALGDPEGLPATLDPALVGGVLRAELGFEGVVVTDALIMAGVLGERTEAQAGVAALAAGCDALLYPEEPQAVIEHVAAWAAEEPAHRARLEQAVARLDALRERLDTSPASEPAEPTGAAVAARAITRRGPARPALARGDLARVTVLDDDTDPIARPPGVAADTAEPTVLGHELIAALDEAGVELVLHDAAQPVPPGDERLVAVVGCRVRAWKGRAGLAPELAARLRALPGDRTTVVALCGADPLAGALPAGAELLVAYGDGVALQAAAAAVLLGADAPGRLPVPAARLEASA